MKSRTIHFIEYLLIRVVGGLINLLPFPVALSLGRPVGIFLFWILKKSRNIALDNLRQVYGSQKSSAEVRKLARDSFIYLAEFAIEWLRMPQIAKNPDRYLEIRNVEKIHTELKKNRGALLLCHHGGNWEIAALVGGHLVARPIGASIYALARPLKNPYLYDYVLRMRGLTGLQSIGKTGAVQETFKRLKENGIVSLLIDQRVSEGSVQTTFFGRKALTTSLPAIAARRVGTPVFIIFMERTPDLRWIITVEGPLSLQISHNFKEDIQFNTQIFNDRLEAEIRKNPSRWLWMHNRWRLEGEPKDS